MLTRTVVRMTASLAVVFVAVLATDAAAQAPAGGGRPAAPAPAERGQNAPGAAPEVSEALVALAAEVAELRAQVGRRVAPVGTVVAFAGPTEPPGWMACDGRPLDPADPRYRALFGAIRYAWGKEGERFRVPDLRGMFLRGTDQRSGADPGLQDRRPLGPDPSLKDAVGSVQDFATALPRTPFATGGQSNTHAHPVLGGNFTNHAGNDASGGRDKGMNNHISIGDADRNHTHPVASGGDPETRPKNASVNWIIKWIED